MLAECGDGAVANRLLRLRDLRTADALQIAAAFFVVETRPSTLDVVSVNYGLLTASRREGFSPTRPTR